MKTILKCSLLFLAFAFYSCKKDNGTKSESGPRYITFNGSVTNTGTSAVLCPDDNLAMCGFVEPDIIVLKATKTGDVIWRKQLYTGKESWAMGIAQMTDDQGDCLFVCGFTSRNNPNNSYDVLLIKFNTAGDTIWSKSYSRAGSEFGYAIVSTKDKNLLIAGHSQAAGTGTEGDFFLMKLNSSGDTLWTKSYPKQGDEYLNDLIRTQDGGFVLNGLSSHLNATSELCLLKVNAAGDIQWYQTTAANGYREGWSVIEQTDGNLLTCGSTRTGAIDNVLLMKYDPAGNVIWEKEYGDPLLAEKGVAIIQGADGSLNIAGNSSPDNLNMQTVMLKTDAYGNQVFMKKFGDTGSHPAVNIFKDINDDNIITGNYFPPGSTKTDRRIFITRLSSSGAFK